MLLPAMLFFRMKIPFKMKLMVCPLFLSGFLVIGMALARFLMSRGYDSQANPKWLCVMSFAETSTAILVATGPLVFRFIGHSFVVGKQRDIDPEIPPTPKKKKGRKKSKNKKKSKRNNTVGTANGNGGEDGGQVAGGQANNGQANNGQANNGQANNGQANSGQATGGQAAGGQAAGGQAAGGQATGGQANSGQANSGQANSGQANSGQANSGQANSGQANSGQANSGQANSGQANNGHVNNGQANEGQANDVIIDVVPRDCSARPGLCNPIRGLDGQIMCATCYQTYPRSDLHPALRSPSFHSSDDSAYPFEMAGIVDNDRLTITDTNSQGVAGRYRIGLSSNRLSIGSFVMQRPNSSPIIRVDVVEEFSEQGSVGYESDEE